MISVCVSFISVILLSNKLKIKVIKQKHSITEVTEGTCALWEA